MRREGGPASLWPIGTLQSVVGVIRLMQIPVTSSQALVLRPPFPVRALTGGPRSRPSELDNLLLRSGGSAAAGASHEKDR